MRIEAIDRGGPDQVVAKSEDGSKATDDSNLNSNQQTEQDDISSHVSELPSHRGPMGMTRQHERISRSRDRSAGTIY